MGIQANNTELVTLSTASLRGAWKVDAITQTLLRPMRMRPTRPFQIDADAAVTGRERKEKRTKQRVKIKKIDPSLCGNFHLRGDDFDQLSSIPETNTMASDTFEQNASRIKLNVGADRQIALARSEHTHLPLTPRTDFGYGRNALQVDSVDKGPAESTDIDISIAEEKSRALALLHSMFGDAEECGGKESIEDGEDGMDTTMPPLDTPTYRKQNTASQDDVEINEPARNVAKISLKDMFKPQETEGDSPASS